MLIACTLDKKGLRFVTTVTREGSRPISSLASLNTVSRSSASHSSAFPPGSDTSPATKAKIGPRITYFSDKRSKIDRSKEHVTYQSGLGSKLPVFNSSHICFGMKFSKLIFSRSIIVVGNFRVEPPGLFHGRGEHPKMRKLKKRIRPRDITINIGKDAPIPECPIPGERWKEVKHDNTVAWLAFWNDPINPKEFKYVFLAASSSLKGQSDKEKYEKARLLKAPLQPDGAQCGYFVLRYMRDIIEGATSIEKASLRPIFAKSVIATKEIDEVCSEWVECIQDHIYDE